MAIKPLAIAGISAALLIAVLAVDASMNRTYALDLRQDGDWVTLAEAKEGGSGAYSEPFARPAFVQANETMQLRVRVDNGYPWAFSETYEVRMNGHVVGDGIVQAGPRATGASELTANATVARGPGEPVPVKGELRWLSIELTINDKTLYATVNVEADG